MKVKDLTVKVPNLKPRDTAGQAVLAAKRNAGGPMKDKKFALKRGDFKHKGRAYENMDLDEALGSKVPYDSFKAWFADLPNGASTVIDEATAVTTAQGKSKDYEGVCGKFDAKKNEGWIYEHYLNKKNLGEAKKAKPKMPEMQFPGVKVSMLQSWQRKLPAAVKELGHDPDMQGYEDGSTVWSVAFPVDRKFDKEAFEDKLRDKLQFSGWMKVVYHDLVEEGAEPARALGALDEGRRHVYGPGDDALKDHPNADMKALYKGPLKVKTKSGFAKAVKVQFFNGGSNYKLDREVNVDGEKSLWVPAEHVQVVKEEQLDEKKPAGAPDFHHSDAPDANGKFKELGVDALADWLISSRKGDMQKISGSLQQQIIFNRKKNPAYAKKMESVRAAVKRKLAKKD